MNLHDVLQDEILSSVRRPSRYVGTELNAVRKERDEVLLRIALVFPDLYELGLGNLGLHILYRILNDLPWCWAERSYAPGPDMEAILRDRGLPLFVNESKDSLAHMDLIGFTLQSELTYTNVLNVIDLAALPLRTQDRDDAHPLTFAGGPGAVNPEPLAPFMDFFVIGDGEEAVVEVAEVSRAMRGASRAAKLDALEKIDGVYVPERYPFESLAHGRVLPEPGAAKIVRRVVVDLDRAPFPTRLIVPFTHQVHDRAGIEVLRGCTRGCRFCQAGMINRPVRERSLERIDALMVETLARTGYEEVSLLSLSTCDYSRARSLLEQSAERAQRADAAVSLPSLRLDAFSVGLADMITGVRRTGLTFAPEAASPRLQTVINKWIPDEELLEVATEAFRRGWNHVKCYFMIGLPTERDEDLEAIVDLCLRVLERGRRVNRKAQVFTSVSTLVPKPVTPFQWAPQIGYEETRRRQRMLRKRLAGRPGIKFGRHPPEATFIEGLIARGDRRAADLIEAAFRRGARLESSSEHLNFQAWLDAIDEVNYDVAEAFRERNVAERLPWDHIDALVSRDWLRQEWDRAREPSPSEDCRQAGCLGCGISDTLPSLCTEMVRKTAQAAEEEKGGPPGPPAKRVQPMPVQRLRFRIGREGEARFLSHLEWMTAWVRALRRASAPLSYSQGYHAYPKVTFATAPPVGEESTADYMDVILREPVEPQDLLASLRAALPQGLQAFEVDQVSLKAPSLMSAVNGFSYTLRATADPAVVSDRIRRVLAAETLMVERSGRPEGRRKKRQKKRVDLRPTIAELALREATGSQILIDFTTTAVGDRMAKPREIVDLLGLDHHATRVLKRATHLA